jgi:hypothetical protein
MNLNKLKERVSNLHGVNIDIDRTYKIAKLRYGFCNDPEKSYVLDSQTNKGLYISRVFLPKRKSKHVIIDVHDNQICLYYPHKIYWQVGGGIK